MFKSVAINRSSKSLLSIHNDIAVKLLSYYTVITLLLCYCILTSTLVQANIEIQVTLIEQSFHFTNTCLIRNVKPQ